MVAPDYLLESLQYLLNHIDLNAYDHKKVPLLSTLSALEKQHEIRKEMSESILLKWFGNRPQQHRETVLAEKETVEIDVEAIARFIGLQLLENKAVDVPIQLKDFLLDWENLLGANLMEYIKVDLLKVREGRDDAAYIMQV